MSFCPRRLLLSRFRAGLSPSSVPQRLRLEPWRQPRRFPGARYIAENALRSETLADEVLEPTASFHRTFPEDFIDLETTAASFYGIDQTDRPVAYDSTPDHVKPDNEGPDSSPTLGLANPRRVVGKLTYTDWQRDGRFKVSQKLVTEHMLDKEMQLRSRQLFGDGDTVRKWRVVVMKIRIAYLRELHKISEIARQKRFPPGGQISNDGGLLLALTGEDEPSLEEFRTLVQNNLTERDEDLLEKLKTEDFRESWNQLTRSEKIGHWERLSLWLLCHSVELLPAFLRVTCQDAQPPVLLMVFDCILFLRKFHPDLVDSSLITTCMHPDQWPILFTPQKAVRTYVMAADRDGIYYAWDRIRRLKLHTIPQTLLCFMHRFTELKDIGRALQALECLRNLRDPEFSMRSDAVCIHCCKLLTLDFIVDQDNMRNFYILPKLIEMEVRLDRAMLNIVLANAAKTGDQPVADEVLQYMKEQEIEPDAHTYITLLTQALAVRDQEQFESLVQEIQGKEELEKNPYLFSKILHYRFILSAKNITVDDNPNEIFYSMLEKYNELHDITPLKELSIVPQNYKPPVRGFNTPPSPVALFIMIATYLRCVRRVSVSMHVYDRFRSLVLEGHKDIAPLAETDHTYNEFLLAFRASTRGLQPSVRLVQDMLQSASRHKSREDSDFGHSPPTFRTWTILMSAFVYQRQPFAAEKVRAMMDRYKVEYNAVTWNTLVGNYVNLQDIDGVATTLREMERSGFAIDEYTMRSLSYLREPERLWVAIEEMNQASSNMNLSSEEGLSSQEREKLDRFALEEGLQLLKERMATKLI